MNKYNIKFLGRQANAIGVTSTYTKTVTATDNNAAVLELYKTHEHIRVLDCIEIPSK